MSNASDILRVRMLEQLGPGEAIGGALGQFATAFKDARQKEVENEMRRAQMEAQKSRDALAAEYQRAIMAQMQSGQDERSGFIRDVGSLASGLGSRAPDGSVGGLNPTGSVRPFQPTSAGGAEAMLQQMRDFAISREKAMRETQRRSERSEDISIGDRRAKEDRDFRSEEAKKARESRDRLMTPFEVAMADLELEIKKADLEKTKAGTDSAKALTASRLAGVAAKDDRMGGYDSKEREFAAKLAMQAVEEDMFEAPAAEKLEAAAALMEKLLTTIYGDRPGGGDVAGRRAALIEKYRSGTATLQEKEELRDILRGEKK
jgi:hypothetical protein